MTKEIWINLPVKNLNKSKTFYNAIGFTYKEGPGSTDISACYVIGTKKIALLLFTEPMFESFTRTKNSDTKLGSEVLISIDAESREEVDQYASKAKAAGGFVYGEPGENQGWMYGCGFADLDGHRWNVLYMDLSKMPKQ